MAKLIKKSEKAQIEYLKGDLVEWFETFHDGRSYESIKHCGEVIKVCPVNLHVKDNDGDVWSVSKEEVSFKFTPINTTSHKTVGH